MESSTAGTPTTTTTTKSKTKVKDKKKIEKEPKVKTSKTKGKEVVLNHNKFEGQGLNYKCKLFGFIEVPGPRGDKPSIQAIQKLKLQARQMKKGSNERKLKIMFNVSLRGVKILNEKTQTIEHQHQIHKISFISHDPEDRHVFGYIYSPPKTTNDKRKYFLFAIKSEKSADQITSQLYELFQVVYKMQETQKNQNKEQIPQNHHEKSVEPLEPLQDQMLLEMSTKLGGEQQVDLEEHLYAEPTFPQKQATINNQDDHYLVPEEPCSATENESPLYETLRNGTQAEPSGSSFDVSPSLFAEDPFFAKTENEELASNDVNKTAVPQISSEDAFPSSLESDSTFEPNFESIATSTEPNVDNTNQFHVEFPPDNPESSSFEKEDVVEHPKTLEKAQQDVDSSLENDAQQVEEKFPVISLFDKSENVEKIPTKELAHTAPKQEKEEKTMFENNEKWEPALEERCNLGNPEQTSFSVALPNIEEVKSKNEREKEESVVESRVYFAENFDENENSNESGQSKEKLQNSPFDETEWFSNNDPFSNTEESTTVDTLDENDPFSFQGASNSNMISDPFSDENNTFTSDFCKMEAEEEDFFDEKQIPNVVSDDVISGDDMFELDFEAKFENAFENNEIEDEEGKTQEIVNDINNASDDNQEEVSLENEQEENDINTTEFEENKTKVEINKLDLSTNSDYVTLKSAAQPSTSPTEFTPPPLPPRPSLPLFDPLESPEVAKAPPALPPRPSNNDTFVIETAIMATTTRKPPELPPRVDLEEKQSSDINVPHEKNNTLFIEDFDNFDFSKVDKDENTLDYSSFEMVDPFKDPFAGDDPFQTPTISSDPFSTPMSYAARSYKQGDPFQGDDPFATTLHFNSEDEETDPSKLIFANFDGFPSSSDNSEEKS